MFHNENRVIVGYISVLFRFVLFFSQYFLFVLFFIKMALVAICFLSLYFTTIFNLFEKKNVQQGMFNAFGNVQ